MVTSSKSDGARDGSPPLLQLRISVRHRPTAQFLREEAERTGETMHIVARQLIREAVNARTAGQRA
jgi:hypothetical protein